MKILLAIFILFTSLSDTSSNKFNYHLIKDYLKWNHIKVTLFVTCERPDWKELENIKNNLKIDDVYLNHWDISSNANISSFNYKNVFIRLTYPILVAVDWECNKTLSMLSEISKRTMFHHERYWLMFGRSTAEMFHGLSGEYINVDAEVAVVEAISEK